MATGADLSFGCWVFISFAAFIHEELQLFIFKIFTSRACCVSVCASQRPPRQDAGGAGVGRWRWPRRVTTSSEASWVLALSTMRSHSTSAQAHRFTTAHDQP